MSIHCKMILVCAWVCISISGYGQARMKAESGVIDLRSWNFNDDRIALEGYWKFFSRVLVSTSAQADSLDVDNGTDHPVPALWNDLREDGSGKGFGTYYLKIVLPENTQTLALEIPQLYNAYTLIADDSVIAEVGKVAATEKESVPFWMHRTATFNTHGKDTVRLLLQLANFHHAKGGMGDRIYLGTRTLTEAHISIERTTNTIEVALLFLLGLAFVGVYIYEPKAVTITFALMCLTWAVRSVYSNLYLATIWFPDLPWKLLVRVEYLTLYFGMIWSNLFLYYLFKNIGSNQMLTYILVFLNILFTVFTLIASPAVFTKSISLYLMVAGFTIVYGAIMVVRALFIEYAGAWFLMASLLVGAIMFGYDIITYQTTVSDNFLFLSVGYMIMFVLIACGLLYHLKLIKRKDDNILTYEDMFRS